MDFKKNSFFNKERHNKNFLLEKKFNITSIKRKLKNTKTLTFISLGSLFWLSSCDSEDLDQKELDNRSDVPIAQFLNDNIPDGISNVRVRELPIKTAPFKANVGTPTEENCVEQEVSFNQTDSDFFVLDANSSLLWPGNLVSSKSIKDGDPRVIPITGVYRNPIQVRVNALVGTKEKTYANINEPTSGKVQDSLNNILYRLNKKVNFPASFEISIQQIHDQKQFQMALKAGYSGASADVAGSLGVDFSKERTRFAVTLKQRFFTVSVEGKENIIGLNGWLKDNVDSKRLDPYVTDFKQVPEDEKNPSGYVESVTYGRMYTLIYESTRSATEVEAALNFAYKSLGNSADASAESKYKSVFSEFNVIVKQLGGDAENGILSTISAMANNLNEVVQYLKEGANASASNPGYPISYKVNYTYNNSPFKVTSNLSYIKKDCDLVYYNNIRVDPTMVAYYGYDHGTDGAELFGSFYVEKYNKDTQSWYLTGKKIDWGYGIEPNIGLDHYVFDKKKHVAPGKFIDFKARAKEGERFRIVSRIGECDASCYVYRDGQISSNEYEYNAKEKKWFDITKHNIYVSDYSIGENIGSKTWNGTKTEIEGYPCYLDYNTYILP
ncbi:thiol-activated cytolysin family protein [Tenacibaculum sp. C7A-26P2]|uniref:thiol-activated cytolysin family protein n=1 Tax=Tenacibaculum sp. C7A-26P2 TaxID=3447504 RepID=UPI003F851A02